jgi:hypothetical protein
VPSRDSLSQCIETTQLKLKAAKGSKRTKRAKGCQATHGKVLTLSFFKNKVGERVQILQRMQQVLAFKSLLQKARREYLGTKKWREASEFILNFFKHREQELLAEPSTDPILQQQVE